MHCRWGDTPLVRQCLFSSSVLAISLAAGTALAQTAPASTAIAAAPAEMSGTSVSQVIVTATRRGGESVQRIPAAVDAYSGETIRKLSIQSLADLSKVDPSLSIQTLGANQQQVIIRGISSTTGQTVGIYVDEAPLEGGFNANILGDNTPGLALHDIDHIEVLKGPQGTLFGAGSMSGTVRVITNQPKLDKFEGSAEASVAGVDGGNTLFQSDAALNIPVIRNQFALRAVGWESDGGGFIDQTIEGVTRHNVNNQHLYGGRLEALWQPSDRFSLVGSINYQHIRVDGAQSWTQFVGPLFGSGPLAGVELGPFPAYENHSPSREPYASGFTLATVTGRYDLGFGKIIATGTYGHKNELELIDTSPSDCSFTLCHGVFGFPGVFSAHSRFTDYTAEARFSSDFKGPFQLVAGFYYEHDALIYDGVVIHADLATGVAPCNTYANCVAAGLNIPGSPFNPASPVEFANEDHFSVNQYAFYGQGDYKILPNLTATVGIRYFLADLTDFMITQQNIAPAMTPNGFDGGYVFGDVTIPYLSAGPTHTHESQPTYNFSLLWAVTPNVSLYARVASGFRIGGINEAATIAAQEGIAVPSSFQPDSLWDYEGGAKVFLLDRRLYLDLDYFHIDWSGQQEDALAAGVFNYTLNVGKSKINGVEFSGNFHPVAGLTLAGSITYTDAYLANDLPAAVVASGTYGHAGDRSPFVPRWTAAFQAEYEHPLTDRLNGYGQVTVSYRSDEYTALEAAPTSIPTSMGAPIPRNFYVKLPAFTLVNLAAGVRMGNVDLSVFVNNVGNTVAAVGAHAVLDAVRIFPAQPRTIGARLSARF